MAVPGLQGKLEPRAKVRIGEKRVSGGGREYPASVDYFVSDDAEVPERARELLIRPAYPTSEETFSTGLEWWTRSKDKGTQMLACYTKGEQADFGTVALRLPHFVGDLPTFAETNSGRKLIACPARACPQNKDGSCKPMGRLIFFIEGGRVDQPLQLDTKSYNSIERIEPVLQNVERATGDLRRATFKLSVAFESKGDKRYPVLSLEVATMDPIEQGEQIIAAEQASPRTQLIALIRARGADPKDEKVAAWVREVGIEAALAKLTEATLAKLDEAAA